MPSFVPPKKNTQFIFYISLVSQANTKIMQVNPTLAAADFNVSGDGGALGALGTTPTVTPAGGKMVKVTLSAAEMNFDNVTLVCSDNAGAEWCDLVVNIQTSIRQIDDLTYPATSGRSLVVDAAGLVDATVVKVGPSGLGTPQTAGDIPARLPTALVGGRMDSSVGALATGVVTAAAFAVGAIDNAAFNVTETLTANPTAGGITSASFAAGAIDAAALATDAIGAAELSQAAADKVWSSLTRTLTGSLDPSAATIVNAVWDEARANHVAVGSFGQGVASVQGNVTGSVTSVSTDVGVTQAGADKVWTSATRTLTAFSAALAVSVWDVLTANILTASSIGIKLKNWALGSDNRALVSADVHTSGQTVAGITDKTGYTLSAVGVTAIWAEVMEGTVTAVQMMRGFAAALLAKCSGLATTTAVYRDVGDTKDRLTATVDGDGNRSAVTRDLT